MRHAADDPLAAQRSGVAPASSGRFLDILLTGLNFPVDGQTGAYTQLNRDYRLQGRLDWNAMQRQGQSHTISLSGNTNINDQDSTRIRSLDLAQHGGDSERNSQLVRLGVISRFGTTWTNNLAFSFSENWSAQTPFVGAEQMIASSLIARRKAALAADDRPTAIQIYGADADRLRIDHFRQAVEFDEEHRARIGLEAVDLGAGRHAGVATTAGGAGSGDRRADVIIRCARAPGTACRSRTPTGCP